MSKRIGFAIFLFFVAFCVVALIEWRVVVRQGVPMHGPKIKEITPAVPVKGNKAVMGHITAQEMVEDGLRMMVCGENSCHNVTITKRTEIIVTNLNGRREVHHTPESVFEILSKTMDCNAAVGITDGAATMVIVYLPE